MKTQFQIFLLPHIHIVEITTLVVPQMIHNLALMNFMYFNLTFYVLKRAMYMSFSYWMKKSCPNKKYLQETWQYIKKTAFQLPKMATDTAACNTHSYVDAQTGVHSLGTVYSLHNWLSVF